MTASAPVNSRFQILDRPFAGPGKCAVCGAVDRPVVDFGLDIRFYGVMYFCITCLEEVAKIIGMIPKELVELVDEGSRQSVDSYLKAHNLKAITDELYYSLVGNLTGLSDNLSVLRTVDAVEDTTEEPAGEFATLADERTSDEQNGRRSSRKRSTSISADSGDGVFDPTVG